MKSRLELWEKLSQKIDRSGGVDACWRWSGWRDRTRGGYGHVWWNGKYHRAHRMMYLVAVGGIPAGMHVLHACDNPSCCNPSHLSLGTHAENMRQKAERQRARGARGEKHHKAKLTDDQVGAIRSDTRSTRVIAADYGVTAMNVSLIKRGKTRAK